MSDSATETLRDNLGALMKQRGWSQATLASKSHVSQSRIAYLLNYRDSNDRHPSTKIVEQLAAALGLSAWQLLRPADTLDADNTPLTLDMDIMRSAILVANRAFQSQRVMYTPEGCADIIFAVYEDLREGNEPETAERLVARMLHTIGGAKTTTS